MDVDWKSIGRVICEYPKADKSSNGKRVKYFMDGKFCNI
jgi:hypothetical protein